MTSYNPTQLYAQWWEIQGKIYWVYDRAFIAMRGKELYTSKMNRNILETVFDVERGERWVAIPSLTNEPQDIIDAFFSTLGLTVPYHICDISGGIVGYRTFEGVELTTELAQKMYREAENAIS